ncbi:S24 family peptidase [Pontibacter sp. H249]|uniref:S24 family peptidase n=1 Tax=Pontibacter sp. H249 TaxID=3133420 RepID=UPI0030C2DB76
MEKLFISIENLNSEWLLAGKGAMFKEDQPSAQAPSIIEKEKIVVATQDVSHNVTIPIVNQEAAANYLAGYQSQEFFEELAPMTMPRFMLNGGQNAVFQVRNDSMEPTFFDSEYVICTKVEKSDWQYINDLEVFVVVSTTHGVQLKRVKNRLKTRGFVRFRSDNRQHRDFSLNEDEILELWRFQWKLSPFAINRAEELYKKVDDMEEKVQEMEDIISFMAKQMGINPKNITRLNR